MAGIHAVLGAARPFGAAVVQKLRSKDEEVRALVLNVERLSTRFDPSVSLMVCNPLDTQSLSNACKGATTVYNCFEPPYYRWKALMPQITSNLLFTAINERADFVFANHLFGPETGNDPVENDTLEAYRSHLANVAVARLPQIYGPGVINGLFIDIFESALKGKKTHWPGALDVPRSLLYLADAAEAVVELALSELARGRVWTVSGPDPITGRQFLDTVSKSAGKKLEVGSWNRGVMIAGSVLASEAREYLKLPYDYRQPLVVDGSDFSRAFPAFAFTPHEVAIAETLEWYRSRLSVEQKPVSDG